MTLEADVLCSALLDQQLFLKLAGVVNPSNFSIWLSINFEEVAMDFEGC